MQLIDFILHIDDHLITIVNQFGNWTYLILFLIVFIETGLVIFPFLPGDSLIFAASAMAANHQYGLNIWICFFTFFVAAVLGDTINYEIGKWSEHQGSKTNWFNKLINQDRRKSTEAFFEKHGGKTIVIGRFIPFIRTFVPFVSGAGKMTYHHFVIYNVLGGFLWVSLFSAIGYFFGNFPIVKEHFSLIVIGIILVSVVPIIIVYIHNKLKQKKAVN